MVPPMIPQSGAAPLFGQPPDLAGCPHENSPLKPAPFDWYAPTSLDAALTLKAQHGDAARFLAGGQSLVPAMNFRVAQPGVLIDLNRIVALSGITWGTDGTLVIGAMTRYRQIERDPAIAARHPLLIEALAEVAHPQIRTRGTLGGNLSHADPASEMPAVMLVLDARFRLRSARGSRDMRAAEFFMAPLTTALAEDEMLAEIHIPAMPPLSGTAFLEVARRRGDYAMMGVAVLVARDAIGVCAEARLAFLSAGPTPMNAPRAALALVGTTLDADVIAAAARIAQEEVDPMGSVQANPGYQRHLAGVLTRRALTLAAQRSRI